MPGGTGYFMSPEGKLYEVWEHFTFVEENPALFGLTAKDMKRYAVKGKNRGKVRQELLTEVIRRDWIRLRLTNEWHFNYWRLDDWTLARIREMLRKLGAMENDIVYMGELSRAKVEPPVRAEDVLGDRAETWVAGLGDVCCICAGGMVPGIGIGDIGVRPVCVRCDAFPLKRAAR